MAESREAIEGMRVALAHLTARVSDINQESASMGRELFMDEFKGLGDEEAWDRALTMLVGFANISVRLVLVCAQNTGKSDQFVLQHLSKWLTTLEVESSE